MSNETGYKSNKVLIAKEATAGVVPTTIAKAYAISTLSMNFDRVQRTETNTLLANGGQPSKTDTGGEDPSGSLELKCTPDWDVLVANFVLGEYTTKTTLNDAHATATAYVVDDVVVLGGTDVLVCKTAGTSDAVAPDITGLSTGDTVTDGTVVWVLTLGKTAMYQYDGILSDDIPTQTLIFKDTTVQGGGITHETLGRGTSITNMSIGKDQGMIVAKTSHNVVAHGALSDTQDGYTSPTVTTEEQLADNAYKRDEICVTIDGVAPDQVETIMLDIDRAITVEDAVKCFEVAGVQVSQKITTIGTPTISGTLSARFSKERFKEAFDNDEQSVVITYRKATGQFSQYTMPKTQLLDSTKAYDTAKPIVISVPLNAYGDISTNGISYSIRSFLNYTK